MNQPLVLVLGGGGPAGHVADWSRRTAGQAARRGIGLIVADLPENLAGTAGLPSVVETAEADYRDAEACRALATAIHARTPLDAVVGFREYSLLPAASAAAALGLPWNSVESIRTARTKDLCRAALAAAGLPQPQCHRIADPKDALRLLESRTGRWIVKPRDAFGSEGVQLYEAGAGREDLAELVGAALEFSDEALVEEFVDGSEYSAEGIIVGGVPHVLEITAKRTTEPPFFVELGHEQPAALPGAVREAAIDTVHRAVRAVGLTHSLFHVEFWVTADRRIVCGEVHSRTGGDWIHALTEHRRPGLELFGSVLDDVLGRPVHLPVADPARRAAVHVAVPPAGRLTKVLGAETARTEPGCIAVDVVARPGQLIAPLRDSFARGAVVAAGTDRGEDAAALAGRIAAGLRFETE
ncbi:ATP-grasp domain-containing protein [Streptomyces sp. ISL-43]|uniref:ATP-grasp domain-containing protein n=1 Tax=Streptomyces sp. ISL-43 TaxID=2819183 RepID=UPI001BECD858|nr:ATP-grasp domain-containing protein [Streptomyces sp. ISL-43]MBT2447834.1 ATP-grasp domain-containing protein [Streptomyces sp. ISL-43]